MSDVRNVRLREDGKAVILLDQTKLPGETVFIELDEETEMVEAIAELRVRGAPAIGIAAGYFYAVLANQVKADNFSDFLQACDAFHASLNASRPTAVNLSWALKRMREKALALKDLPLEGVKAGLYEEARAIQEEDIAMCTKIAEHGLSLIEDGAGILTHCNAGPLATSKYGTALGPILLGKERGMSFRVFADETRPLLQGARLTTFELQEAGVDVTLICDNMASQVMENGWVDAVFVGCDRVAANGDAANKIGTRGVAILAKYYDIPFYVLGPSSTIDLSCKTGDDIEIELRDGEEIRSKWYEKPMAPEGVRCYNPAFDVTPHELITAIVTEKGVFRSPFDLSLATIDK